LLRVILDEPGDHSGRVLDPVYPLFTIAAVMIDEAQERDVVPPAFDEVKQTLLGDARVALRTSDLIRNRNGFERFRDPRFRGRLLEARVSSPCRWREGGRQCVGRQGRDGFEPGAGRAVPADQWREATEHLLRERMCVERPLA